MGKITVYIEDEVEKKMLSAVKSSKLSKSKWIAQLIQEKVDNEWPLSIMNMAGTWQDYPSINDIRSYERHDGNPESL